MTTKKDPALELEALKFDQMFLKELFKTLPPVFNRNVKKAYKIALRKHFEEVAKREQEKHNGKHKNEG